MTKNFLFGFLFSVLLIGLVACGQPAVGKAVGDSGSSDSGSSEVVNQSSGLEDSAPKTGAEKSSATKSELKTLADVSEQPSGVFNRLWSDPPTLDPHLTSDTTSAGVVVEIFGGLVGFDTNLQLIPDLADSWDVSTDGLTYTFKIRENAAFHDGTKVTAGDFKWSLERAVNPDTASPTAKTYLGDIVGVEDVLEGRGSEIRGVKAVDDVTLQIQIDAPKAYFLAKLTYPTAYVVDKNNVSEGGLNWTDNPNGTGPFRLTDYKIGERIILERNDLYHLEKAKLAKIQMNLAGGSSMAMYENDEIDITGVGLFDLERIKDPGDPLNGDLVVAEPGYSVNYIGFNVEQPPFDDPKFRRALNHAIDKELIAREVYSDLVVPAYGILPPGFPGFNESLEGLRHDPVLAKKLLSESKYADPVSRPRIVVTIPGTGGTPGLDLEVIINMWLETLGVEVEIQQVEWATYLKDLDEEKFQAFGGLGWEADYPDPQDFLDILFHSDSENNHGLYSNQEADVLLEDARVETDSVRRIDLYQNVEEIIINDAAWVPLWFAGERHVLIKPYVKGYELTPMTMSKMRYVYIED